MTDIICASIISIIFLSLFVIAEFLRKKGAKAETTRKFVHFSGAFVTIFFPFILNSHWTVLPLAVGFALIMLLTKKFGWLQSVHGVERKSDGAIYHPIAIYTCFLYSQILNQPMFYVISILILAISDALAALVGKSYGANEYLVEKTVYELNSFNLPHKTEEEQKEGVSLKGADNLFIPLGTMFILSKNITPTIEGISFQIFALIGFLVGYLILMMPYKRIGFSGVTLLGLINYIIWALLGNIYAIILFAFSFICAKTDLILNYDCDVADAYRVRPIFYILTVPVVCAFLGSFIGQNIIYPFITSIICEGIIIRTRLFDGDLNKGLWLTSIVSAAALGVSYVFI